MDAFRLMAVCSVLLMLGGCSTGAYLLQAAGGHLSVLQASRPIQEVLSNAQTPDRLKQQLQLVHEIRDFSVNRLGLPDNDSYRNYADLKRPYAVWNVVAAPVDSLDLQTWCFLFTGCISYKGYYKESEAYLFADELRIQGLDVAVMGVPAYSTLGFTPDPVLNTFIYYPAGELARMVFHELAHQVVYIADDTQFNESFATAVEEIGVNIWLEQPTRQAWKKEYLAFDLRRVQFRQLLDEARQDLGQIYKSQQAAQGDLLLSATVLILKEVRLNRLRSDYQELKSAWGGWAGYDRFMSESLNNAKLAVGGLYTQHVPAFKALFKACDASFARFYGASRLLGQRTRVERDAMLAILGKPQLLSEVNIVSSNTPGPAQLQEFLAQASCSD